ncbi:MAG: hypothetical protein WKF48_07120 [Solirubrobacteraceae bacterium]
MSIKDTARKIPGVAAVEGAMTGALAEEHDLPITDYDSQSASDIASKLKGCSQRELRTIDAYERKHENRTTITDKIAKLSGDEPWSGYDEQSVDAIKKVISEIDVQQAMTVRDYERPRKDRTGVVRAAQQRIDSTE